MRYFIVLFWFILLTLITARYYHRLRHIRLEKSFCRAYRELKDNKCSARLASCSTLDPIELRTMRQLLCGFRFDPGVQTDPPTTVSHDDRHPKHFADVYETDIHSYGFMASIYSEDRRYLCSGALVSPRTVVTSAKCVRNTGKRRKRQEEEGGETPVEQVPEVPEGETPADAGPTTTRLFVRFGEQHLNINPSYKTVYEYDVESVRIHERFDEMTNENDIAIIRLVNSVPVCKFAPIYIPRKFEWWLDYHHVAGCSATYMGWGLSNQKPYFRALSGEILPHYFCEKLLNWDPNQLSHSHICVSPSGVCISDTGGPLITYANHHWVLIGVMSFGKHCRTPGLPLIFTRISEFHDFIYKYIEEDFHSRNATLIHEECHSVHPSIYPFKTYPKPEVHDISPHLIHDISHKIDDNIHIVDKTGHSYDDKEHPFHYIDFDHLK